MTRKNLEFQGGGAWTWNGKNVTFRAILFKSCCEFSLYRLCHKPRGRPSLESASAAEAHSFDQGHVRLPPSQHAGCPEPGNQEQLRVVCAGKNNLITKLGVAAINASCTSGTSLTTSTGLTLTTKEYNCSDYVSVVAKKATENCEIVGVAGSLIAINIGFELTDGLYTIIKTCFDETSRSAIYSKFIMTPSIAGQNVAEPRAGFVEGTFYPDVSVDSVYAKVEF